MSLFLDNEDLTQQAQMIVSVLWRRRQNERLEQIRRHVELALQHEYDYRDLRELADDADNVGL